MLVRNKTVCPEGMQFFLAQVEQGKDTVCVCLRASAVNEFKSSAFVCVCLAINIQLQMRHD